MQVFFYFMIITRPVVFTIGPYSFRPGVSTSGFLVLLTMKQLPITSIHYAYLLRSYEQWLTIIGYAAPTVNKWPVHVRELLHYLEGRSIHQITLVTSRHIEDFADYIKHRANTTQAGALSGSTINTMINAINSFFRYLDGIGKHVLSVRVQREEDNGAIPTILTVAEIKELYEATFLPQRENSIAFGQRDRAIIAVFYGCGLRRSEGIALNCTDIDLNKRLILVRNGKGGKQRYVPIASKHAEDLRSYLEEGREWFLYEHYAPNYTNKHAKRKPNADEDAFFISKWGKRMLSFYERLQVLKEAAGISKKFGLHSLRHSIATHLLNSGMEIEEIARFLGHSTLDSTQIYTHLANELHDDEPG
jgi:integrase/recombinase XerD